MNSFLRQFLAKLFTLSDLAIMVISAAFAAFLDANSSSRVSIASFLATRITLEHAIISLVLLAAWHGVFSALGLYESKRLEARKKEVKDVLKATSIGTISLLLVGSLFRLRMMTPIFFMSLWILSTSISVSYRLFLRRLLAWMRVHGRNRHRIVIVGTNQRAVRFARSIQNKPELGYELVGFVDEEWPGREEFRTSGYSVVADCDHFPQLLREHVIDEVVLALPMRSCYLQASRVATQSREQGILIRSLANIFDLGPPNSTARDFDPEAAIMLSSHACEGWPSVIKRLLDIVISAVALVILAPLFLVTAIVIRSDSPGSIFFTQERIGLNKRRFHMYKFRTMVPDAESMQAVFEHLNEADGPVFKIKNDPRITRLGKYLRKTSIDELPQLLNVLKGDMSVVGPRPLAVRDYNGLDEDWLRRRFSVRPGITCLWQVNGRSSVPFQKWMEWDLHYIDHWSLWLDVKVIAKTIPAVLKGAGAA